MKHLFKTEFAPGIYNNLEETTYRADGALSTSDYKLIAETPKKFKAKADGDLPYTDSQAMERGRWFHLYALERSEWDRTVKVCPTEYEDKRYKESKAWWASVQESGFIGIKEEDRTSILSMYAAYSSLKEVAETLTHDHQTEVSVFCKGLIGKNDTKCRVDLLDRKNGVVVDIKTTRAGGANPREFVRTSRNLKYYWQQANYTRMLAKHGVEVKKWYWAVVETAPPFEAGIYTFSQSDIDVALAELKEADRTLLACQELDSWPSYTPSGAVELKLFGGF